mmetsp:Transcript_33382/g.110409  ORF Transcript_33382/g.110409 Transcript_33382/m.110409 type:complete len:294 (-) Transcript_33382:1352-2233(-)
MAELRAAAVARGGGVWRLPAPHLLEDRICRPCSEPLLHLPLLLADAGRVAYIQPRHPRQRGVVVVRHTLAVLPHVLRPRALKVQVHDDVPLLRRLAVVEPELRLHATAELGVPSAIVAKPRRAEAAVCCPARRRVGEEQEPLCRTATAGARVHRALRLCRLAARRRRGFGQALRPIGAAACEHEQFRRQRAHIVRRNVQHRNPRRPPPVGQPPLAAARWISELEHRHPLAGPLRLCASHPSLSRLPRRTWRRAVADGRPEALRKKPPRQLAAVRRPAHDVLRACPCELLAKLR